MQEPSQQLQDRFRSVLDRHGHSFQYAVIRRIKEIYKQKGIWSLEVAEFPTAAASFDTRIDFIVRPEGTRFFLVCECKRANPSMSDWCFAKAPFVHRNHSFGKLYFDLVNVNYIGASLAPSTAAAHGVEADSSYEDYHIGLEVKNTRDKGDAAGGRNALEQAAGQVLRGVNGLIQTLATMRRRDAQQESPVHTFLMPAIFTTARIWTSSVDLGVADIETGKLPVDDLEMKEVPWLVWQYPMSPALKHNLRGRTRGHEFAEILDPEYMRSIAVVSANGIDQFFSQFSHVQPFLMDALHRLQQSSG